LLFQTPECYLFIMLNLSRPLWREFGNLRWAILSCTNHFHIFISYASICLFLVLSSYNSNFNMVLVQRLIVQC
jgi:hypothetical protein